MYNRNMEIRNEQQEKVFTRRLTGAGLAYSGAAVFPMLVSIAFAVVLLLTAGEGATESDGVKYANYLIPQLCFGAVCILFFARTGVSVKSCIRPCKLRYFLLALLLQFGLLFSLSELNGWFIGVLEKFGYQSVVSDTLPDLGGWRIVPAILVIAVLPALFEETLFRGIMLGGMRENGWGTASAVLVSGARFSLFHGNPEQTIYQFICGMCFALLTLRAGSILPTMLSHFCNNAVILTIASLAGEDWAPTGGAAVAVIVCSALCLAAGLALLLFAERKKNTKGGIVKGRVFFSAAAVGIVLCLLQWSYVLVMGFSNG